MAARKNLVHSELVRERIRTSALVNFLTNYALGKHKKAVDPARITAALGVLRKALPDLASVEHSGEVKLQCDVSANPLTPEAWDQEYGADRLN
jgi:hypothetical protein